MKKETARDIAIAMIARSGESFDGFAFDDCEELISEKDTEKIMNEIVSYCGKMVDKIENKYNINLGSSTESIIKSIVYEPE